MGYDLNQTVRVFFERFPWQGRPLAAQQNGKGAWHLDLTLPVAQFWGAWPWDGVAMAAEAGVTVAVPTLEEWMSSCWGQE